MDTADDQKKARGELAQHAFETAGRVQLLAEHMDTVGWRIDGYSTTQLKELANLLLGTAIRAALASDNPAIVSMVMGKPMTTTHPYAGSNKTQQENASMTESNSEALVCVGCGRTEGHPEGCDLGGYMPRHQRPLRCVGCGRAEGHTELCDLGGYA